jgi:hypothetical protein
MQVTLDEKTMIVYFRDNSNLIYDIDLVRCRSSAALLDWIYQIRGKRWCSPEVLAAFVEAVEHACQLVFQKPVQGVFCSWGCDYSVDWIEKTTTRKDDDSPL